MNWVLFFAATYGAAIALAVLHVGTPFRIAGVVVDRFLFPKKWVPIVVNGKPVIPGGPVRVFVHCPACLAFWIALGLSYWMIPAGMISPHLVNSLGVRAIYALAATALTWIVHVVLTRLGQYDL